MIGYTMVGTSDLRRSKEFYNPLLKIMGFSLCYEDEQVASWGKRNDETVPRFFSYYPYNGNPASIGNGTMTAFQLQTPTVVNTLYQKAIKSSGCDQGQPGFRPERYGNKFYVAYVQDPDGNKLAFACYNGNLNP